MYQTKWKQNNNKKKQQTQSKTDAQQSIAFNSKKKTQIFLCAAQTNSSSIQFHFAERLNTVPCVLSSYSILYLYVQHHICSHPHRGPAHYIRNSRQWKGSRCGGVAGARERATIVAICWDTKHHSAWNCYNNITRGQRRAPIEKQVAKYNRSKRKKQNIYVEYA